MVWHTVWFKLKPEVSDEAKQEMLDGLRRLPSEIEEISSLACGEDFADRSKGFHVGLVVSFAERADLEEYGPHPAHQEFVSKFTDCWDEVVAVDFED